jgi:hypothetical protein
MFGLEWVIPNLSNGLWFLHACIFALNIALLVFARPFINLIEHDQTSESKVRVFQALNVLVLILHVVDLLFLSLNIGHENYFIRLGLSLMTIYGGFFVYSLACYFSKKRFGIAKTIDDTTVYIDSYSSRLIDLILLVIIILSTIFALIKVWGADSLLETTGIIGIIFAFLAFTSNIWAPDIISGLIILNTEMLDDGDVIFVDGHPDEYVISKVTLIYVVLYDIRNNHRTLIRNNQFIRNKIDNLSRVASTDGIRQSITYKIGYPQFDGSTKEERGKQLAEFKARVDRMFMQAQEACTDKQDITINEGRDFEWAMTNAGDYAMEYTLWVYLEKIPNTKVTSKLRRHLMGSVYKINEAVYGASIIENLDLSTPMQNKISLSGLTLAETRGVISNT